MAVPPGVIDEIRDRADLLSIVGDYVSLKKAGRNWVGLCPFHSEKTPSFSVSPEKGMFYCFGCSAGGDVFGFLRQIENLSFMEAVERLAQRTGVQIPEKPLSKEEKTFRADKERLAAIVEESCVFYHRILTKSPEGEEGREYLKKRGISIEMARAFRLGWAPREWEALLNHLGSGKNARLTFLPKDMEKAGMVVERRTGGYYDRFRGRIMFPIMSVQGRVLAFGGRLVANEEGPKYMNSPESPLYSKSRVLYGLNTAHKAIRDKDSAIIVEGYFDALAMVKNGFDNVVAPCGTALTVEQVRILTRYTGTLTPLFDADEAGEKARMRALEVILEVGAVGRSVVLPEGLDPDDFLVERVPGELAEMLQNAPPLLDKALDKIINESGAGVEGRRKALTGVAELLLKMSDSQAREMYIREISERLAGGGLGAEDLLRKELAVVARRSGKRPTAQDHAPEHDVRQADVPEYYLLALALAYPHIAEALKDEGDVLEDITDDELAELGRRIIEEGAPHSPSQYLENLSDEKTALLSRLIIREPDDEISDDKIARIWVDTVTRVKLNGIKRRKEDIQGRLNKANPDELPQLLKLKKELQDMGKKLKEKR